MKIKFKAPLLEVPTSGVLSADMLRQHSNAADAFIATILEGRPRTKAAMRKFLEQYYTDPNFVLVMMDFIEKHFSIYERLAVEPSAGDGSILRHLPGNAIAMEVDSVSGKIIKANFLATTINTDLKIAVIGNPPFRYAQKFFNHAATLAKNVDRIAMILPLTFRRLSMIRKLNRFFHLVAEMDVPALAFLYGGVPYNVRATLQIWEKRDVERVDPPEIKDHPDFVFATAGESDFGFQRVGENAGRVHDEMKRPETAHLFIKSNDRNRVSYIRAIFDSIDWASVASNTSAKPYITRSEIYAEYTKLERLICG